MLGTATHNPIKSIFSLVACLALVGCTTIHSEPKIAKRNSLIQHEYTSPDSNLLLRFDSHSQPCSYNLIDKRSGKILAHAQSSIYSISDSETRFNGVQHITFGSDGSGVVISEDISDASQLMRHILIHRPPLTSAYKVQYILPPWIRFSRDEHIPCNWEGPIATSLTNDDITLYYPSAKTSITLWIGRIEKTEKPTDNHE